MKLLLTRKSYQFNETKTIKAPGSKSEAIRYLIGAFLSKEESFIRSIDYCDDVNKTIECLLTLGASIKKNQNGVIVKGIEWNIQKKKKEITLNVGSSGTLLRLLLPVVLNLYERVNIIANEDLMKRPMDEYQKIMEIEKQENGFYCFNYHLQNELVIEGNISSQYASGILFAQSMLGVTTSLKVLHLESKDYLNMTVQVLKDFGIKIEQNKENEYKIIPSEYHAIQADIHGDYSQAAFFFALGTQMKELSIFNLGPSYQADEKIVSILQNWNASIQKEMDGYKIKKSEIIPYNIDVSECIDLSPILFVMASFSNQETVFNGTKRLIYKESNREFAMQTELAKAGISLEIEENKCIIKPHQFVKNNLVLFSYNDHRIAMALTVFALSNKLDCKIEGIECINKSFPNFLEYLNDLGIEYTLEK